MSSELFDMRKTNCLIDSLFMNVSITFLFILFYDTFIPRVEYLYLENLNCKIVEL